MYKNNVRLPQAMQVKATMHRKNLSLFLFWFDNDSNFLLDVSITVVIATNIIIRCADTFSEEEANSLLDTAEKIAHYECFLHLFEQVGDQ